MKDLTKNELSLYEKMLNNKWDEVEDLMIKENISNPILLQKIFSARKWDIALKILRHNKGIDLNGVDKLTNNTILMTAIADNTSYANEVAKFLVDNNAKLDLINKEGLTALMIACKKNNLDMFKYLLQHNDDINVITHRSTLLMSAIEGGNTEIVENILQRSNNINVAIDGENALSLAVKGKKFDIANMLIYHGITIPNQDVIVNYLTCTRDMNLIYQVLNSENLGNVVKDRLMKTLINQCSMKDLLKVGDIYFRQNLARVFFEDKHNLDEQKQAIDAFLESDIKEYIKNNFCDSIRAFLIDCRVENWSISYISAIENEFQIQDYSNHFEQISKSIGMPKNAFYVCLNRYLLILCQQRIYQENIENFSIGQSELETIIAYNLIDIMEDFEFRERYKKFYFDNILKCDKEMLDKLQPQDESMISSIYNWLWGIKDDIIDLNKDIHTISENNLLTYNLEELEGFKRMHNDDKIWAKDTLYYSIMSIRYLADKLKDANITSLDGLNDILTKKNDNVRIIQSVINCTSIKPRKVASIREPLHQNYMNYAIDNEYVFVRGIGDVYKYATQSLHNETYIDIELRKGLRTYGQPTLTKKCSDKNGNINRSCTMINFGTRVFGNVGLGFIKKDIDNISLVASRNVGTGTGRKREVTRVIRHDSFIDSSKPIKEQLCELLDYLKRGGGKEGHNEVIIDLKYPQDVSFIYYCGDKAVDFLSAVYIQRKYEESTGKRLAIFKIAPNWHYPIKQVCTKRQIKQALEEALCKNTSDILDKDAIDFILCFKDELKSMPSCKAIVEHFIKGETPDDIYQVINIAKVIGEYQSPQKQSEYLLKYTNIFIQKQNFMYFIKERLKKKDDAKRKNRGVELYLEIMDEICKISTPEIIDAMKSVSCDTLKNICEYCIKRNDITSIDDVFDKCANKPYLTIDHETKGHIVEMMEEKQKQRIDFLKEYNISL